MQKTTLIAACVIAGVGAALLWYRPAGNQVAIVDRGAANPTPMAIIPEVRVTSPEAQAAQAVDPAPKLDPADPVAHDIEMRKRNPNYIGVVQGKSGWMQLQYPDLARELGMTPAEAEALYDLLMKHQQENMALPRYSGEDAALARETTRVADELRRKQSAELDALLAGRQAQWKDYQVTLDARRRVSELTNMVNTTSPLSEQQARQLVATVVAEQQRRASELSGLGTPAKTPLAQLEFEEAQFTAREQSNRRTVETSRAYLTEQQVTIMQNAMEGVNGQMREQLRARRAQLEGGTSR